MPIAAVAAPVIGSIASALIGRQKAPKSVAPAKVDLGKAVSDSISINNANFDANAKLTTKANDFTQSEATRLLESAIPGFGAIQSKLLAKINEDLTSSGLPSDVASNLKRLAAERGITRGTSGNFNEFSLLKDFGFNLVDWENAKRARALNTLSSVYGMAPRINPMTPMASFVTPGAAAGVQQFNETNRYNEERGMANAQTAAGNFNRSLWAGAVNTTIQGVGKIALPGGESKN